MSYDDMELIREQYPYPMKLILLSKKEVKFLPKKNRIGKNENGATGWWLRDRNENGDRILYVTEDGTISKTGGECLNRSLAIRPAMYLPLSVVCLLPCTKKGYFVFGRLYDIPVQWIPINIQDSKVLFVSKKTMRKRFYDDKMRDFQSSSVCNYLNRNLLEILFSDEEREKILFVKSEELA